MVPRMIARLATLVLLLPALSSATTPPRPISPEEWVCGSTHIAVGKGTNFRVVTIHPGCQSWKGSADQLTPCQAVEVDVEVAQVIKPGDWNPDRFVFRFGGGLFSTVSLKADLDGVERTFLLKPESSSPTPSAVFGPSYPWRLGVRGNESEKISNVLKTCTNP